MRQYNNIYKVSATPMISYSPNCLFYPLIIVSLLTHSSSMRSVFSYPFLSWTLFHLHMHLVLPLFYSSIPTLLFTALNLNIHLYYNSVCLPAAILDLTYSNSISFFESISDPKFLKFWTPSKTCLFIFISCPIFLVFLLIFFNCSFFYHQSKFE
jgi:hypothetical protein